MNDIQRNRLRRRTSSIATAAALLVAASAFGQQGAPNSLQRNAPAGSSPFRDNSTQGETPPPAWRPGSAGKAAPAAPSAPQSSPKTSSAQPGAGAKPTAAPKLSITSAQPAFAVAPACKAGAPLVTIDVVIRNEGSAAFTESAARLFAQDEAKTAWRGQIELPKLAPDTSRQISIPVYPPSYLPRADGAHRFSVYAPGAMLATPVVVNLRAGICAALAKPMPSKPVVTAEPLNAPPANSYTTPKRPSKKPPPAPQPSPFGNGGANSYSTGLNTNNQGAYTTNTRALNTNNQGAYATSPTGLNTNNQGAYTVNLTAPMGLTSTVDPQVCSNHAPFAGGLACATLLPQGRLALVWNASGAPVDGFNVYRVDGGQRSRVGRQANGKDVTVYIVDPVPAGGYTGKCYAVSAYKGAQESEVGPSYCPGTGSVVQTVTLAPLHIRSVVTRRSSIDTSVFGGDPRNQNYDDGRISAGYRYWRYVSFVSDGFDNDLSRTGLYFDTAPFAYKKIRAARLKLTVDTAEVGPDYHKDHTTSCVARVGVGKEQWWPPRNDWIEAYDKLNPGMYQGPTLALDVTEIVKDWARSPNNNYGLVLMGSKENLDAFTNDSCVTAYFRDQIVLEVEIN
jgi:hypothetical protein